MAKKEVKEPTIWEQFAVVWVEAWDKYCADWKALWLEYKSIIIPFVKGTFAYAWQLIAGLIGVLSSGLYGCGKIIYELIIKLIKKA